MTNLTIVMYHYVRNLSRSRHPGIKGLEKKAFKEQLNYILKYYTVIRAQDLFEHLKGNCKLPKNSLLLTFDDGYKDHFDVVFPILDELGIQGSFFPPAKAIQTRKVLDVNKIHFTLAAVENPKVLIAPIYALLDKYRNRYDLRSNSYYHNKFTTGCRFDSKEVVFIKRMLQKGLPEKLRKLVVDDLFRKYVSADEEMFSRELYMSCDQLKCMIRHGMYVGSHGWDHFWLDALPKDRQENEIRMSLKFLKSIGVDTSQWIMCYPYGAYNKSLISILKVFGCKMALTTEVRIADLQKDNPFVLPRLDTNDLPKKNNAAPNRWTLKVIDG